MGFMRKRETEAKNTLLCLIGGMIRTSNGREVPRPAHSYVTRITTTYLKDPELYEAIKIAWNPIPPDKDKEREKLAYQIVDMLKRVEKSLKVRFGNPSQPQEEIFSPEDYPNYARPEGKETSPKMLWKTITLPIIRKYP